jgi:hypothetical protein
MKRLRILSALMIFVAPAAWSGGQSGCHSAPDSRETAIPVRALTLKLTTVDNLSLTNFELTQHRSPLNLCGFTHVRQPSSIGILLDISGSMAGYGCGPARRAWSKPQPMAWAAVDALLSTSGTEDEYFLGLVNERPTIECAFTRNVDRIRAAIQVKFKGKTALLDGMYLALNEMRRARCPNRVLLVISDGCDNLSSHKLREISQTASDLTVAIFFLTPGHPQDGLRRTVFPGQSTPTRERFVMICSNLRSVAGALCCASRTDSR